jgi:hypothetical protein
LGYGHGGWEGIKSGKAKVYSLVDEKGNPHVTVEVGRPELKFGMTAGDIDPYRERLRQQFPDLSEEKLYYKAVDEFTKDQTANLPPRITQIKGKQNRAPNEQYLPFVQDFVKSGQWDDVGDINNTGLIQIHSEGGYGKRGSAEHGGVAPGFYTRAELDAAMRPANPPDAEFAGGGSVKTGIKGGVDLARRSLFGLKPSQEMKGRELAPVQRDLDKMQAELNRAEKTAPKVEERSVSIDPGKGSAKITDTVQKVASTPVSRRTVLKSATGQVLQNALPMQSFADLMKPVEVVKQAAQAAAPAYGTSAIPGLVASYMRKGMSPAEAGREVERVVPNALQGWAEMVGERIKSPADTIPFQETADVPLMDIFGEMVRPAFQRGAFSLRPEMRELRRLSPEDYSALKETARDIKEYGFEP